MAKGTGSHSEMARARHSDGLSVIFDQKSPASSQSYSRSRSRSHSVSRRSYDSSRSSGSSRGRDRRRRYYRSSPLSSSSSSSSRSRSSSRFKSRSHPRCHRRSSRCRCDDHGRRSRARSRRSPPRCYRAHSRSFSRSPARRRRSRSRSSFRWSRSRGRVSQYRCRFSQSPSRSRSRSRSSGRSASLSLRDKRELLEAAKANAMKSLGVEKLALPESVKPILSEPEREPEKRVRHGFEKTAAQGTEEEPDDVSCPRTSQKGKIAFSINNSVAKPTAAAPPTAKVTPRVDSVESRKPYGRWIPVRSGQSSRARKRT